MDKVYKLRITNNDEREIEYHEKLKQIAIWSYSEPGSILPEGVHEITPSIHLSSGLDVFVLRDDGTKVDSYTRSCGAKHDKSSLY